MCLHIYLAFVSLQTPLFSDTPNPGKFVAGNAHVLSAVHKQHASPLSFCHHFPWRPKILKSYNINIYDYTIKIRDENYCRLQVNWWLKVKKNEIMLEQKILICKHNVHVFVTTWNTCKTSCIFVLKFLLLRKTLHLNLSSFLVVCPSWPIYG